MDPYTPFPKRNSDTDATPDPRRVKNKKRTHATDDLRSGGGHGYSLSPLGFSFEEAGCVFECPLKPIRSYYILIGVDGGFTRSRGYGDGLSVVQFL